MQLFIDYLENISARLRQSIEKLQALNQQYKKVYDKQLREEIAHVKKEMMKERKELKQ